jgi:Reverse transcriptase (RNA-dependent DNA polymerase)
MDPLKNCVTFWNCGGGIKSKFDYLKMYISVNKPSVMFISECEILQHDLNIIKIQNYDLLVSGTLGEKTKARLCCYIHSSIKYKMLHIGNDLDLVGLDILNYRLVGLYRGFKLPPGANRVSFFNSIIKALKRLSKTDKKLIIGGDFNVDINKKTSNLNDLNNWAIDAGLSQLVTNNTWRRIVSDKLQTSLIDHIYTNDLDVKVTQIPSISDHDFIVASKSFNIQTREKILMRDWRGYNKEKMNTALNTRILKLGTTSDKMSLNCLTEMINESLDELAPNRVIRVKDKQIISQKLEKAKKRRDRQYRLFKKTNDTHYLHKSIKESKLIKKLVKTEATRTFQMKSQSPDPKKFWNCVNEILGKHRASQIEIIVDDQVINSKSKLAEMFADFFVGKVRKLSSDPVQKIVIPKPEKPLCFSQSEIMNVVKSFASKKCLGPDGVPQNVLKDVTTSVTLGLVTIFDGFAANGLPDSLKEARVIPLHKKGSTKDINNYRPISNLSPFSKLYERCLLKRLESELPHADGLHQHGFKQLHSTETALLTIQSYMSTLQDNKKHGLIYSIDLSAAFDLLKPDKFFDIYKDKLSQGLLYAVMDFLQDRTLRVDIDGFNSDLKKLDRGCVQGSVLGPKLFSIYLGNLETELREIDNEIKIVSFADDTYVIISGGSQNEVVTKTEKIIGIHVNYLKKLGMVVNESKTEIMWLGKKPKKVPINICGIPCAPVDSMKALGVFLEGDLSWDVQAEKVLAKGRGLLSTFRFIRKYMTESQFLKTITSNFYNTIFYCSSVWLQNCKAIYKTQLTSLHFRLLRSACKDYHFNLSRDELSKRCQKATPNEWSRYSTASVAMKVIRDKTPKVLHDILKTTYYSERRKGGKGLFYDSSRTCVGRQSIQNRLKHIAQVSEPWNEIGSGLTNDRLRILLKKTFFGHTALLGATFDLGGH